MRVLFLAYYLPPLGGGGVQRSINFVRYLPQNGYERVLIPGLTDERSAPTDEASSHDIPDSVEILRVRGHAPE